MKIETQPRKWFDEFREFIQRGNVIDLAVGVIIGAAFGKIVSSLVADVIMPPIGEVLGGMHFTALCIRIGGPADAPVTINYGNFIQTVVDFLIVAFCVFLLVKGVNAIRRKEPDKPTEPSVQEKLLTEIRDLLKGRADADSSARAVASEPMNPTTPPAVT
jgi:large conductance mechanosensitive channel